MKSPRFFVRHERDIRDLAGRIAGVVFDEVSTGAADKNGNLMIGLSKRIGSRRIDYRGLVVVCDESLFDAAEKVVSDVMNAKQSEADAWLDEATARVEAHIK